MSAQGFEPRKLLELIKHPNNSLKLEPKDDWLYGFIGAALGVIGFAFWFWALQSGFVHTLSLFATFIYGAAFGDSPTGRCLWIGIASIIVLLTVLTIAGNWIGRRKRNWMEASAYHGGAQVWFGAACLANGLIALAVWKLSLVIMMALLLLNLSVLLSQAVELHEVTRDRKFAYMGLVLGVYAAAILLLISIF